MTKTSIKATKPAVAAKPIQPTTLRRKQPLPIAPKIEASAKAPVESPPSAKMSKKDIVLDLLRRLDGATIDELTKATGWQKHSVRGFISGSVKKEMGLTVLSIPAIPGDRGRVYRIVELVDDKAAAHVG